MWDYTATPPYVFMAQLTTAIALHVIHFNVPDVTETKMAQLEPAGSSERSIETSQTVRCDNPDDSNVRMLYTSVGYR